MELIISVSKTKDKIHQKSPYKGVSQNQNGKWVAEITNKGTGKREYLGSFDSDLQSSLAFQQIENQIEGVLQHGA